MSFHSGVMMLVSPFLTGRELMLYSSEENFASYVTHWVSSVDPNRLWQNYLYYDARTSTVRVSPENMDEDHEDFETAAYWFYYARGLLMIKKIIIEPGWHAHLTWLLAAPPLIIASNQ